MRTGSTCDGRRQKAGSKIVPCLIVTALCGLMAMQPAYAKVTHRRGAPASAVAHKAIAGKSAKQVSHDPGEGGITLSPPTQNPRPDTIRGAKAMKIVMPGSLQARRLRRDGSPNLPARNAIGVAVAPQPGKSGQGEDHLGAVVPTSPAPASGSESLGGSRGGLAGPATGKPNMPTASLSTRGTIDGAKLIRPAVTPSGIGGAARTVSGINGTTFRPKR